MTPQRAPQNPSDRNPLYRKAFNSNYTFGTGTGKCPFGKTPTASASKAISGIKTSRSRAYVEDGQAGEGKIGFILANTLHRRRTANRLAGRRSTVFAKEIGDGPEFAQLNLFIR
jgi:hypothetical protein